MRLEVKSELQEPSDKDILEYARHVRQLLGAKMEEKFLRGECVVHIARGIHGLVFTHYKLSEPAKGLLREEKTKEKTPPQQEASQETSAVPKV